MVAKTFWLAMCGHCNELKEGCKDVDSVSGGYSRTTQEWDHCCENGQITVTSYVKNGSFWWWGHTDCIKLTAVFTCRMCGTASVEVFDSTKGYDYNSNPVSNTMECTCCQSGAILLTQAYTHAAWMAISVIDAIGVLTGSAALAMLAEAYALVGAASSAASLALGVAILQSIGHKPFQKPVSTFFPRLNYKCEHHPEQQEKEREREKARLYRHLSALVDREGRSLQLPTQYGTEVNQVISGMISNFGRLRARQLADQLYSNQISLSEGEAAVVAHLHTTSEMLCRLVSYHDKRFDCTYGPGHTFWEGALDDGVDRGDDFEYFCPSGWQRFGLRVDDFQSYTGWNVVYHGTSNSGAYGIVRSTIKGASYDIETLGVSANSAYFSPCINYCAHPRYAAPFPLPHGRWAQVAFQCRINPKKITNKIEATLLKPDCHDELIDSRYDNNNMEWTVPQPSDISLISPSEGKNKFVCYGLMYRILPNRPRYHPSSTWWYRCHGEHGKGQNDFNAYYPNDKVYSFDDILGK